MILENELIRIELNRRNHPDKILDAEDAHLMAWVQFNRMPWPLPIWVGEGESKRQKIKVKYACKIKIPPSPRKRREIEVIDSPPIAPPGAFYELYTDCYLREAKAMIEGKHWEGKNRCVKLPGDE